MLNWHSCHQLKHKLNVANNFIYRVAQLSRNEEHQNIIELIQKHLKQNDFPKQLVNRLINTNPAIRSRKSKQKQIQKPTISLLQQPNENPTNLHSNHDQPYPNEEPQHNTYQEMNQLANNSTTHNPDSNQPSTSTNLQQTPHSDPSELTHISKAQNPDPNQPSTSTNIQQISHSDPSEQIPASNHHPENIEINDPASSQPEVSYRSVPYVPLLTDRLIQCLATDYPNVRVASRKNMTVGDLFSRVKDPKRIGEKSNLIYQIPCQEPCSSVYIGLTKNTLDQRLSGHRSNIKTLKEKRDKNINKPIGTEKTREKDNTALIDHIIETGHTFNISNTSVLDTSYNKHTLNFLEMCHIFNTPNTVNQRTDCKNLSTIFASVLSILHEHNYRKKRQKSVKNIDSDKTPKTTQEDSIQVPPES